MTELIWEGKYDKDGRKVAPLRVALPFQTVETVNESSQDRQRTLDLFQAAKPSEWRNRLIWGDKKYVLPALLQEFAGAVDLVYIDPPFATGQDFSLPITVNGDDFVKQPSMIEVKAYRDTWGRGLASYLQWLYEMAIQLHELLAVTGSLYVHLDPGVSHFVKVLLDEVFGPENFRNEIVWKRSSAHSDSKRWGRIHDVLLYYAKSATTPFLVPRVALDPTYVEKVYTRVDEAGRRYRLDNISAPGGRGPIYEWGGKTQAWRFTKEKMEALHREGRIKTYPDGRAMINAYVRYLDENEGQPVQDWWDDVGVIAAPSHERVGYPTQKPLVLLTRIIEAATKEGDLVLDCVCGSGTTGVAAERLGRRWIVADLGRFAVHTTRKRLLSVEEVKPFVVQNLGKYERQVWQAAEFGEDAQARTVAYRRFILDLYKAKYLEGYVWLHGVKQGRMVHVGTVDAPVTVGDVKQIAGDFGKALGTGEDAPTMRAVDVLGWDFAFELNELAKQTAERAGLDVRFLRIPREVLDKRAVEQGDVRFFELAALGVEVTRKGRAVTMQLSDFVIPIDDVPEEVQRAITDWSQWIDYWAVDWDNKSDTFHNEWQAYRTRKEPTLPKSAAHEYDAAGTYQVVVKVIDILGNDTTKTLKVEVP
ncbi:MAG: DNA methyltransferase [Candidatus Dormibacteria bacterium]|jgi:DNA modification methylase|nr:site-specific DNA-methyltransferase [Chloroflexota bacterium]